MATATQLQDLAKVVATSVDWRQAERINKIFPGFLKAYEDAQDAWEKNPQNRELSDGARVYHAPISKRIKSP